MVSREVETSRLLKTSGAYQAADLGELVDMRTQSILFPLARKPKPLQFLPGAILSTAPIIDGTLKSILPATTRDGVAHPRNLDVDRFPRNEKQLLP